MKNGLILKRESLNSCQDTLERSPQAPLIVF
nr:MAG TPA: hypothetical protein [Caudoviricetes sp.]